MYLILIFIWPRNIIEILKLNLAVVLFLDFMRNFNIDFYFE